MAEAKKTAPKRMYVSGRVSEDLWRDFRSLLIQRRMDVTEGLEQAINDWNMLQKYGDEYVKQHSNQGR